MLLRGLFFCLFFLLAACSREAEPRKAKIAFPKDEASAEERAMVASTVEEIERISAELGQAKSFREVPVIVSDDRSYTDRPGACVSSGGEAQFILVKKLVLRREREFAREGLETTLFRVLLHEIGHCYLKRKHDDERIFSSGEQIELTHAEELEPREYVMLDASVMASDTLVLPLALRRYYVAELLRLDRARDLEGLARYAKLRYVSREPGGEDGRRDPPIQRR